MIRPLVPLRSSTTLMARAAIIANPATHKSGTPKGNTATTGQHSRPTVRKAAHSIFHSRQLPTGAKALSEPRATSANERYQCSPTSPRPNASADLAPLRLSIKPTPKSSATSKRNHVNPGDRSKADRRTRLNAPTPTNAVDCGSSTAQQRIET